MGSGRAALAASDLDPSNAQFPQRGGERCGRGRQREQGTCLSSPKANRHPASRLVSMLTANSARDKQVPSISADVGGCEIVATEAKKANGG